MYAKSVCIFYVRSTYYSKSHPPFEKLSGSLETIRIIQFPEGEGRLRTQTRCARANIHAAPAIVNYFKQEGASSPRPIPMLLSLESWHPQFEI